MESSDCVNISWTCYCEAKKKLANTCAFSKERYSIFPYSLINKVFLINAHNMKIDISAFIKIPCTVHITFKQGIKKKINT